MHFLSKITIKYFRFKSDQNSESVLHIYKCKYFHFLSFNMIHKKFCSSGVEQIKISFYPPHQRNKHFSTQITHHTSNPLQCVMYKSPPPTPNRLQINISIS